MAALTKGLHGKEMSEIGLLKKAGAVAFSNGRRSITSAKVMRRALTYAKDFDALIVHHTEDDDLADVGVVNEGEVSARLGLPGIPEGGRDRHGRARHPAGRAVGRPLSRRADLLPREPRCHPRRQEAQASRSPAAYPSIT